jgi:tRNA 2-thiouridine synthesizing protein A
MDDVDIDARGLICPLPVLRLRKRLQGVAEGGELTMLTDDPVAVIDVPHFCGTEGHEVVENRDVGDARFFRVRCGGRDKVGTV